MKLLLPLALTLVLVPGPALATITFTQIDDDVYLVSHRVKGLGSRAKATRMVYLKAASLCKAAGYSHLRVLGQESEAVQQDDRANATLRVRFFLAEADERIDCEVNADPGYVREAGEKLRKRGYTRPNRPSPVESAAEGQNVTAGGSGTGTGSCTIEQITAMARTGLSDERIRAACREDPP